MTLYPKAPRTERYRALIRERLPQRTVEHVESVTEYLLQIAPEAGVDAEDAMTAGLLHDLHKATPQTELVELAIRYGLPISAVQRQRPKLLHGPVAAEEAFRELGVTSEGVYDAICWHTTGRAGLGRLGMALYIADFSEPLRTHPEAAVARSLFETEGFLTALRYVAKTKLRYATLKPPVDPNTQAFHDWLHSNGHGLK